VIPQPRVPPNRSHAVVAGDRSLRNTLLIFLASLLLALAFTYTGSEVTEGDTRTTDMRLLLAAQALRVSHPWLAEVMRNLSGLGSTIVITLVTSVTVIHLALFSARMSAVIVAVCVGSGAVLVSLFKALFGRPRPDPVFADVIVQGLSFPSGHAAMSAMVFLTLGVLLGAARPRRGERIYILCIAALLTGLVGASRIVLGVHWATDDAERLLEFIVGEELPGQGFLEPRDGIVGEHQVGVLRLESVGIAGQGVLRTTARLCDGNV